MTLEAKSQGHKVQYLTRSRDLDSEPVRDGKQTCKELNKAQAASLDQYDIERSPLHKIIHGSICVAPFELCRAGVQPQITCMSRYI